MIISHWKVTGVLVTGIRRYIWNNTLPTYEGISNKSSGMPPGHSALLLWWTWWLFQCCTKDLSSLSMIGWNTTTRHFLCEKHFTIVLSSTKQSYKLMHEPLIIPFLVSSTLLPVIHKRVWWLYMTMKVKIDVFNWYNIMLLCNLVTTSPQRAPACWHTKKKCAPMWHLCRGFTILTSQK